MENTNKVEKLTNSKALAKAIEILGTIEGNEDVVAKLVGIKTQVDKKSSSERKPTATQKENEDLKVVVLDFLATTDCGVTISDMLKQCDALSELTNQRLSAIVRQLVNDNLVVRTMDKRKALFSLATAEVSE